MYRRFMGLLLLLMTFGFVKGQLSISLQEPPAGVVQKSQLWNIALIYSGNTSINVVIRVSLVDSKDNQPVLTATTSQITILKGVKQLKLQDISPIDFNYYTPGLSRLSDALLPVGNFRACYTVFNAAKMVEGILAEDCINIDVLPLSPPQLVLPEDAAKVQTPYPQFSWIPPAPISLFTDLNYELILTEVREDQTSQTAVQENLPIYSSSRLKNVLISYPASHKSLDTGKVYAWRVIAKNGESVAAQSEVWTFSVVPEKQENLVPAGGMYLELKNDNGYGSSGVIPDNVLGIKYYSYDKSHETIVRFVDVKGEVISEETKLIDYGNNFLVFKLNKKFTKDTTYFIEVTDLQQSRYRASFRMSN